MKTKHMIHFALAGLLIALSSSAGAADAKTGESLFSSHACIGCHSIGADGTATTGPNLLGVTRRRTGPWLESWIKNPDGMRADPEIVKLKVKYPSDMPNLGLSDDEAQSLILYLKSKDTQK